MADLAPRVTFVLIAALIASVAIVKAIAEAVVELRVARTELATARLLGALKGLVAIRPTNWDDGEDPDQVAAWEAADEAIALTEGLS